MPPTHPLWARRTVAPTLRLTTCGSDRVGWVSQLGVMGEVWYWQETLWHPWAYLRLQQVTVLHQRKNTLPSRISKYSNQRPLQILMARGLNIHNVTERRFTVSRYHRNRSKIVLLYSPLIMAMWNTIHSHREVISN